MEPGLLTLRVVFGLALAAHSSQKLFGWFGGPGIGGTAQMMEQLGFRPPRLQAVVAGLVEGGSGLALAAGLLSPLAAGAAISIMFVATMTVHLPKGFFNQNGGFEYPLALATGALAVALMGPGAISADAELGIDWSGPLWGVAALAIGLVGGGLQLMGRRPSPVPKASDQAGRQEA
jgi:putative oxidoreductase